MVILGITHPISWNTASCIIVDGKLVAMAEEERFIRIKHAPRVIPEESIKYCLKQAGVGMDEVDCLAVGWGHPNEILRNLILGRLNNAFALRKQHRSIHGIIYDYFFNKRLAHKLVKKYRDKKVIFVRHHLAHAASAFFSSGFDRAAIVSLNGSGGDESGILAEGYDNDIKIMKSLGLRDSWGAFYEEITEKLGFRRHSGEGKVMGLAAYGKPDLGMFDFIDYGKELPDIDWEKMLSFVNNIKPRFQDEPLNEYHKNLAATLQAALEKAAIMLCEYLKEKTGLNELCIAGGVGLNCTMNGKILASGIFGDVFIQPAAHDAGSALGAAIWYYIKVTGKRPDIRLTNSYLGPEYSDGDIEEAIKAQGAGTYRYYEDICEETANLLAQGRIIGWFQSRMEIGPRALGARSIIANPSIASMKDKVNNKVKHREPWRPFAPSILSEYVDEYVEKARLSPFMLLAFKAKKDKINEVISAAHVDGTIRIQTVEKSENPKYWDLIDKFRQKTGVAAILNTSFNVQGEPIVCSPHDALRTFFSCGLDYLAMGNFLISK